MAPDPIHSEALAVGPLETNAYLVWREGRSDCLVIDPGGEGERIAARLRALGLVPVAILLTHGHMDHVSGVIPLQREFPLPLYLGPADRPFLDSDVNRVFAGQLGTVPPTAVDHPLTDGTVLTLAGLDVEVLATPGHTPGSVSLLIGRRLYSGDTLFFGSVGRTDLPGGDSHRLQESLARLCRLPGDTPVFPGHGEETTIAIETDTNPYLP